MLLLNVKVMVKGSASGIVATTRLRATIITSLTGSPWPHPNATIAEQATTAIMASLFARIATLFCRGVLSSSSLTSSAINPSSVFVPVDFTVAFHLPFTMVASLNTFSSIFF